MPLKKKDDYIPIKCEGWNGKFHFAPGTTNNVSKVARYNQNVTDTRNFYGFSKEPTVLPVVWDGSFRRSDEVIEKPERNRSDDREYFQYNTQPTVLPPVWNGRFD